MLLRLVRVDAGAAPLRDRRESGGLSARAGAHVQPQLVLALNGRGGEHGRNELAPLILDSREPVAHGVQPMRVAAAEQHSVRHEITGERLHLCSLHAFGQRLGADCSGGQSNLCGGVVCGENRFDVVPAAPGGLERLLKRLDDPPGMRVPKGEELRARSGGRADDLWPLTGLFADAAQNGVDESSRALSEEIARDDHRFVDGRVRRGLHCEQLLASHPQQVEDRRVDVVDPAPFRAAADDRVPPAAHAEGAVAQIRGVGGVELVQAGAGDFDGKDQVGVRVVLIDRSEDLEGDEPGSVGFLPPGMPAFGPAVAAAVASVAGAVPLTCVVAVVGAGGAFDSAAVPALMRLLVHSSLAFRVESRLRGQTRASKPRARIHRFLSRRSHGS